MFPEPYTELYKNVYSSIYNISGQNVEKVSNAIHRMNCYLVDNVVCFVNTLICWISIVVCLVDKFTRPLNN